MASFFTYLSKMFTPPFRGLPWLVWGFVILCYATAPFNPLMTGDLPDADDYTYLSHTLDWLAGQSWTDITQYRLNPPAGTPIHFTRLAELPMAAGILTGHFFGLSLHSAAMLTAATLPLLYLGLLMFVASLAAARLAAPAWGRIAAVITIFGGALMSKFMPGRVDHHGLVCVLVMAAIVCLFDVFDKASPRKAAAAGALLALAMAIALEALPWLLIAAAFMGLWALVERQRASAAVNAFALALAATSLVLLLFLRLGWGTPDILMFSSVYVLLAAGIAVSLASAALVAKFDAPWLRWGTAIAVALLSGGSFLAAYPTLLQGPYGAMDSQLAALFFKNISEAVKLFDRYTMGAGILRLMMPLMALAVASFFVNAARGKRLWQWALMTTLLTAAFVLTALYQARFLTPVMLFSIPVLVAALRSGLLWIGRHLQGRRRFAAEIALCLLIAPLPTVLLPAFFDGRSFNRGVLAFPAQSFDMICSLRGVEGVLNRPPYLDRAPLRIANFIDTGAELIFRTPHAAMSAPYHMNVTGNLESVALFRATDAEAAHDIVTRNNIDMIAICPSVPGVYGIDGKVSPFTASLFLRRLPAWLHEIPAPRGALFRLYEVVK